MFARPWCKRSFCRLRACARFCAERPIYGERGPQQPSAGHPARRCVEGHFGLYIALSFAELLPAPMRLRFELILPAGALGYFPRSPRSAFAVAAPLGPSGPWPVVSRQLVLQAGEPDRVEQAAPVETNPPCWTTGLCTTVAQDICRCYQSKSCKVSSCKFAHQGAPLRATVRKRSNTMGPSAFA